MTDEKGNGIPGIEFVSVDEKSKGQVVKDILEEIGSPEFIITIIFPLFLFLYLFGKYISSRKFRINIYFRRKEKELWADYHDLKSDTNPPLFTAFHPRCVVPESWYTLLIYIWFPKAFKEVRQDFRKRKQLLLGEYTNSGIFGTEYYFKQDIEITIVPELAGCRFNPPKHRVIWLEDWHSIEFRMQIKSDVSIYDHHHSTIKKGRIAFYVGPLLIAETEIEVIIYDLHNIGWYRERENNWIWKSPSATAYRKIFVSYSHKDTDIVTKLEKAYTVLGDQYLRDVKILRSGEEWNVALLSMIEKADIFQLCWSNSSKESTYVEQEWRYAFGLERNEFIRPIYWEIPMPEPPPEFSKIHFAYLEL